MLVLELVLFLILAFAPLSSALAQAPEHALSKRALVRQMGNDQRIPQSIRFKEATWTRDEILAAIGGAHRHDFRNEGIGGKPVFQSPEITAGAKLSSVDLAKVNGRMQLNKNGFRGNPGPWRVIVSGKNNNFIGIIYHTDPRNFRAEYDVDERVRQGRTLKGSEGGRLPEKIDVGDGFELSRKDIAETLEAPGKGDKVGNLWRKKFTITKNGARKVVGIVFDKNTVHSIVDMRDEQNPPLIMNCRRDTGNACTKGSSSDEDVVIADKGERESKGFESDAPNEGGEQADDANVSPGEDEKEASRLESEPGHTGEEAAPPSGAKPKGQHVQKVATKEVAPVVEDLSAKEFGELVTQYKVSSFVEKDLHMALPKFRTEVLQYKAIDAASRSLRPPTSFGQVFFNSAGKSFRDLERNFQRSLATITWAFYAKGLYDAMQPNVSTTDRIAAVSAIVPVLGCATDAYARSEKQELSGFDWVDVWMCEFGDGLILAGQIGNSPHAAALGVTVHIARFVIDVIRQLPSLLGGPSPKVLRNAKASRDDALTRFLHEHHFRNLTSDGVGAWFKQTLANDALAFLSEGAQIRAVVKAIEQTARNKTTDAEETKQLTTFFAGHVANATANMHESLLRTLRKTLVQAVNDIRHADQNISIKAIADQCNDRFIKVMLKKFDDRIQEDVRNSPIPLPNILSIAYLLGQSMARPDQQQQQQQQEQMPTKALAIRAAQQQQKQKQQQHHHHHKGMSSSSSTDLDHLVDMVLNVTDILHKHSDKPSDPRAASVKHTHALISFLHGHVGESDKPQADSTPEEIQILTAMSIGRNLRAYVPSNSTNLTLVPDEVKKNPSSAVASILAMEERHVQASLKN